MTDYASVISAITSPVSLIALAWFGWKGKLGIYTIKRQLTDLEYANKREHREIEKSIEYTNSRNELTKALTKACNSSITYTQGSYDINTFKTLFTNAVIGLSMATLTSGFKFISEDVFHGYMEVAGDKIINSYSNLHNEFIKPLRIHIKEASEIYYSGICNLISDDVFNDKHDRFVDATISFLRTELMIITKHWWQFSGTDSTYKL